MGKPDEVMEEATREAYRQRRQQPMLRMVAWEELTPKEREPEITAFMRGVCHLLTSYDPRDPANGSFHSFVRNGIDRQTDIMIAEEVSA